MTVSFIIKIASIVAIGFSFAVGVYWLLATENNPVIARWDKYTQYLNTLFRRMFLKPKGKTVAVIQLILSLGIGVFAFFSSEFKLVFLVGIVAIAPSLYLNRKLKQRLVRIDDQVQGFLVAFANALKVTPSLGDALTSLPYLLSNPIREEIELAVKEMYVGSTLDQTFLSMAQRVGSKQLDAGLSSILIGRQIGGNIPFILEKTAIALREMARLEGVLRTKTAEAKAQLWVLVIMPFALCFAINSLNEGYFSPLKESLVGQIILTVACLLWISSLIVARKILRVEL